MEYMYFALEHSCYDIQILTALRGTVKGSQSAVFICFCTAPRTCSEISVSVDSSGGCFIKMFVSYVRLYERLVILSHATRYSICS